MMDANQNELKINQTLKLQSSFKVWLQNEFTKRNQRNPSYSIRSFSNTLKMDSSTVSQILKGSRKASAKVIKSACELLGASPNLTESFIKQSKIGFKQTKFITPFEVDYSTQLIAEDSFAAISEWYHIAIMELLSVDGFKSDASWCAEQLNIKTTQAQIAIERLLRLELVRYENNQLVKTNNFLTNFTPGQTSAAHKNYQRQILQMALDAIDNTEQNKKDITGVIMAIDIDKIDDAKKLITKFRREFCSFVEDGHQSQVYQLAIQFYPVSKNNLIPKGEQK